MPFGLCVINALGSMGELNFHLETIILFWINLDSCILSSSLSTIILVIVQNAIG